MSTDSPLNTPDNWPDYYADPVGHCLAALQHGDDMERFNAADILRGLARDAESAIPVLAQTMRTDSDNQVRAQCAFALGNIGYAIKERATPVIPALIETLRTDTDAETRSLAASALRQIGLREGEVISALQQALQDEHEWVREAAKEALESLET